MDESLFLAHIVKSWMDRKFDWSDLKREYAINVNPTHPRFMGVLIDKVIRVISGNRAGFYDPGADMQYGSEVKTLEAFNGDYPFICESIDIVRGRSYDESNFKKKVENLILIVTAKRYCPVDILRVKDAESHKNLMKDGYFDLKNRYVGKNIQYPIRGDAIIYLKHHSDKVYREFNTRRGWLSITAPYVEKAFESLLYPRESIETRHLRYKNHYVGVKKHHLNDELARMLEC